MPCARTSTVARATSRRPGRPRRRRAAGDGRAVRRGERAGGAPRCGTIMVGERQPVRAADNRGQPHIRTAEKLDAVRAWSPRRRRSTSRKALCTFPLVEAASLGQPGAQVPTRAGAVRRRLLLLDEARVRVRAVRRREAALSRTSFRRSRWRGRGTGRRPVTVRWSVRWTCAVLQEERPHEEAQHRHPRPHVGRRGIGRAGAGGG